MRCACAMRRRRSSYFDINFINVSNSASGKERNGIEEKREGGGWKGYLEEGVEV